MSVYLDAVYLEAIYLKDVYLGTVILEVVFRFESVYLGGYICGGCVPADADCVSSD